jgi:hypothetical protein
LNTQQPVNNKRYCELEEDRFHGDLGFYWYVQQMIDDAPALLTQEQTRYMLTEMGEAVLAQEQSWKRLYSLPHWLGGYCISQANERNCSEVYGP